MSDPRTAFLPDRLRPAKLRRRSRRGLVLASVVPMMLLALPMWRVEEVDLTDCPMLPSAAVEGLEALEGQPALGLNLEAVRDRVRAWPGVGEVQVELVLPGTLRVRAREAVTVGSVKIGSGWHGVESSGRLTGVVAVPVEPVLEGFDTDSEREAGLAVALRVATASSARVHAVRRITPHDYRLQVTGGNDATATVLHVAPQATVAELAWSAAFSKGSVTQSWADVRAPDRIVVGSRHD